MKRFLSLFLTLTLVFSLAACAAPESKPGTSTDPPATSELQGTVVFADPVLEAMVRGTIGKPEGDITAAEAAAVTRLVLSSEWEQHSSEWTPIKDLSGLEYFTNLESLDLSGHAITDITPLAGLSKLTVLALGSNPITDISPLTELRNLRTLILYGCTAPDYSPLANLTSLEYLALDNSTMIDATPLASLTNLRRLYLEGCELDYTPLMDIYPNLEDRDFVIMPAPSTLAEMGFVMDGDGTQAVYDGEQVSVRINHIEWGMPMAMGAENCVRVVFGTDEYKVDIGYYPEHNAYVVQAHKDGEFVVNYVYSVADGGANFDAEGRKRFEAHLRVIFPDAEGEDLMLEPVSYYNAAIDDALGMTATELFELPFAPPSLANLGFTESEEVLGYLYIYQEADVYFDVSIHDPEQEAWEGGGEVRFFAPLSEEYRIVVTYHIDKKLFTVGADDNDGGGAEYSFFLDTGEHIDGWCSDESLTVEQYFMRAINDPSITDTSDVYQYSVKRMVVAVEDTFGMSIDELYALPK